MKIRCDFVTNSSSSSFIIAIKNWDEITVLDKESELVHSFLMGFQKAFRASKVWTREKDVKRFFEYDYGSLDQMPERVKKCYDLALEKFNEGYTFIECRVEYGSENIVEGFDDGENIIIVAHGE